ncbi:MAG: glycoside hydrolase family 3 C-terminal domain-containing protein, partial [Muribaculaceae bacterium]
NKKLCVLAMGGSSWVHAPYEITVLEGIRNILGDAKVTYLSSDELGGFVTLPKEMIMADETTHGVNARYYKKGSNEPVVSRVVDNIDYMWEMKSPVKEISVEEFREARFDTWIHAQEDGKYTLKFIVGGGSVLAYNNEWAGAPIVIADPNSGTSTATATLDIRKGQPFHLCMIYTRTSGDAAVRVEVETPKSTSSERQMARIRKAAKKADAVIVVGGIDHSIDTEGRDRASIDFPLAQQTLVENIAKYNKNVNLVLLNGSPLEMCGVEKSVKSIVEAWYPGLEGGNAVAEVLFGKIDPSGRLPFTWAKTLDDYPSRHAHQDLDHVLYTDSLNVGYRYFDVHRDAVLYPFGFGLSYTTFEYSGMTAKLNADGKIECSLTVANAGKRDGMEVVQIYVRPVNPSVARPVHELKAFAKVALKQGESKQVNFTLTDDAFSYYSVEDGDWRVDPCRYIIEAGSNTVDIRQSCEISIAK